MSQDNPEPGSGVGSFASGLAKILGYGFSAAGIPVGPMLLGGASMYDERVSRAFQGKTVDYLSSLYPDAPELPILRMLAQTGQMDARSAMEYIAAGRTRRAYASMGDIVQPVNRTAAIPSFSASSFPGAPPSDVIPAERQQFDVSEFYRGTPTMTEALGRAREMALPGDIGAEVYRMLLGSRLPAEPDVPRDVVRRQGAGSYARFLEGEGVPLERAVAAAEASSRGYPVKVPDRFETQRQQLSDEVAGGKFDLATASGRLALQQRAIELRVPDEARKYGVGTSMKDLRQESVDERMKTELLPQFRERASAIQADPKLPEPYKRAVAWAMDQFEANPTEKGATDVRRAIAQQDQAVARAEQAKARLDATSKRVDAAMKDRDARRSEQLAISEQTRIQAQLKALRSRAEATNPDPVDRAAAAHEYTQLEEQWYRLNEFLQRRIFTTPSGAGEAEVPRGGGARAPGGTRYRMKPDGTMQRVPAGAGVEG